MDRDKPQRRRLREGSGRFAYEGLQRVIHEKARLGIMTSLVAHPEGLLFADLKQLCALTDGNLNRHLQVLRDARLIEVWKGVKQKRPQTLCRITPHGRARFLEYIGTLEKVIADAADAADAGAPEASAKDVLKGLSPA